MDQALPDDVCQFLHRYIPSVSHLELLLFLFDGREQSWTIERLSREMRSNETLVRQQVGCLNGPIRKNPDSDDTFQFVSNNLVLREIVRRLAELYRSHRHTVISTIYSDKDRTIRSFAEAFKIRK